MGLAGLGGMLIGLDTTIDPADRLQDASCRSSPPRSSAVSAASPAPSSARWLVGVGEELSLLVLSPAYRSAIGFLAILLVLTFRPRGILGAAGLLREPMEHYLVAMAVTAGIYALMALGMNVIWGMAGLINLGLVGFFAVGAYVSALLTLKLRLPIAVGVVAGAVVAAAVGVVVALITVGLQRRLSGDRDARLRRDDAHRHVERALDRQRHRWPLRHPRPVPGDARPAPVQSVLPRHRRCGRHRSCSFWSIAWRTRRLAACCAPSARTSRSRRSPARTSCCSRSRPLPSAAPRWASPGALYGHFTSYIAPDLFAPLLTLYVKLSLLDRRARQQQGRGPRRRACGVLSGVDALHRAADPEPLGRAGRRAARATDLRRRCW